MCVWMCARVGVWMYSYLRCLRATTSKTPCMGGQLFAGYKAVILHI